MSLELLFFVLDPDRAAADDEWSTRIEACFAADGLAPVGAALKAAFLDRWVDLPYTIKTPLVVAAAAVGGAGDGEIRGDIEAYPLGMAGWGYDLLLSSHSWPGDIATLEQMISDGFRAGTPEIISDPATLRAWHPQQTAPLATWRLGQTYMLDATPARRRHAFEAAT